MLHFSIRDVLWLMVVVAVAYGSWAAQRVCDPENALLRREIDISRTTAERGQSQAAEYPAADLLVGDEGPNRVGAPQGGARDCD